MGSFALFQIKSSAVLKNDLNTLSLFHLHTQDYMHILSQPLQFSYHKHCFHSVIEVGWNEQYISRLSIDGPLYKYIKNYARTLESYKLQLGLLAADSLPPLK